MSVILNLTEGWTAQLGPFTLRDDVAGTVIDLTGISVALELRGSDGAVKVPGGTVTYDADRTTGKVYYKPVAGDFVSGKYNYLMRWQLTDGSSNVIFVPNGEPDEIAVYPK